MKGLYDVIIVGAGPAGIFAALELAKPHQVLVVDKGPQVDSRECYSRSRAKPCVQCKPCSVVSG